MKLQPIPQFIKLADIKIGKRYRKSVGDLRSLSKSLAELGLLHPIIVSTEGFLVAGARRMKAAENLGWTKIKANVLDLDDLKSLQVEHDENEEHEPFTVSERVEIARTIQNRIGNRQGERTDTNATSGQLAGSETREEAAKVAGFSSTTQFRRAETVVDKGAPSLIDAMDKGEVTPSAAATIADALPKKKQAAAVKSGTVPEVAKKVRATRKKKPKAEPARPDQPSLPKTGRKQPHVEPTKKGRPTEFGMLADLETTERCVKELQQVRASLDFLARHGNGVSEIAKNVFGTDDPDGIYILHEMKRPDPANHNMITPFMTCEALEGFLTRMFLIGHEIIRLHGADEVVDRGETITF